MARFSFRLPDIGEGISEAEIVAWHVAIGDRVEEDGRIADMMTDKATVEMESPVAGIVIELAGEPGDSIPIGSTLVVIETEAETESDTVVAENPGVEVATDATPACLTPPEEEATDAASPPTRTPAKAGAQLGDAREESAAPATKDTDAGPRPTPAYEEAGKHKHPILASPAVRARARDLGIDLAQVRTESDRVRHADLDAHLRYGQSQGYHAPHASRARDDQPVKVIGMRRRIADNMAASKRHIPHFTYVEEVEVTALEAMRADLNANRGDRPKLTLLPLFIAALCRTLPDFPMLNARYDDEAGVVTRHGRVHMGMATQTDAGLMVPVIRDAQDKNVWQLAAEITRLAEAARTGKARSEELSGGTITVTSLGPLGGVATTPVINRPEVAIVGPNRIVERPVFVDDGRGGDIIRRAKLMNVSISCDHRVVDGRDAASFVQALKKLLETPVLLFAD
ncbi:MULTISPECIES: dihydrolipoamide acetyltransferase family protein [Sphingomonas]|uniref:dihydrolipoamide acetyltransferase family protein n=1 Tax=Sphingomonas TaxID=13687 RepID=UPI000F7D8082|nr:dihydrolipoamide acetyltransferase family protein [Sphingomonas sp. ABOLF]RSV13616.1 2-oxo acid dehydrogenase subunit E2 [Sphingomonas sp. ABOLF]GLK20975.1 lipoamide acyltransferase component of branched-chain alpha-keto acid dehydrogenase complex [Microbacterium terregens]